MRKKYLGIITVFVILFQLFVSNFTYVEARRNDMKQPEACNGPSEMMSYYFDFQNEAIEKLLGSKVNSLYFSASFGNGGLFSDQVLDLKGTTAIDFLASSLVGSLKSFVSNSITSVVLLSLASASAVQSNTEGLIILLKDRPIVRDYKQMMDIETRLFDVAYFRSKQIDLTRPFGGDSELLNDLESLIKKYQGLGLLEEGGNIKKSGTITMADILLDLVEMNAAMKHFIMIGGDLGTTGLRDYNGCFGSLDERNCNRNVSILKFSDGAIDQLSGDYKDVRTFGKCNSNANFFKSTINKTINNNADSVKTAVKDVKFSIERLKGALMGSYDGKKRESRCDMTDYEMAQLQAYRGGDWSCNEALVDVNVSASLLEARNYFSQKKVQSEQKKKEETVLKMADKPDSKEAIMGNISDGLKDKNTNLEREQFWFKVYGNDTRYNSDFSFDLNSDFLEIFDDTMDQYWQAQENAMATDLSDLLPSRGKGILDQMNVTIKSTNTLEGNLQNIEDKQCTG